MSEITINTDDIFLALFARSKVHTFHWAFIIPTDMKHNKFMKVHATQSPGGPFFYQAIELDGIMDSNLTLVVKLGTLVSKTYSDVHLLLKDTEMRTNRENGGRRTIFDCKIWIRQSVTLLHTNHFIVCSDALALEHKCEETALAHEAIVRSKGIGGNFLVGAWSDPEKKIVYK